MHKVIMPEIEVEKCDGCGLCVSVCARHGLILVDNVVTLVKEVECDWCTECEAVCPTGAISCPFEIVIP
jgi:MinD superfamily P-loop ATPase